MSALGPYTVFITTSYGLVALVVAGLIAAIVLDYRRQQAELRRLEASGVTRRSGKTSSEKSCHLSRTRRHAHDAHGWSPCRFWCSAGSR